MTEKDPLRLDLDTLLREQELYEKPLTEKQRDILAAAEKLFAASGYSDTSTASIAREAGVTEKTLFKHFPTKKDLFRRILFPLILKVVVPVQVSIVRRVLQSEHKHWRDLFATFARDRWATARGLGPRLKVLLSEVVQNDRLRAQLGRIVQEQIWPEMVKDIEARQKAGELRDDVRADAIARLQIAVVAANGLLRALAPEERTFDDENEAREIADLILHGINARESTPKK